MNTRTRPFRLVGPGTGARVRRWAQVVALLVAGWIPGHALAQTRTGEALELGSPRVTAEVAVGMWEPPRSGDRAFVTAGVFATGRLETWADGEHASATLDLDGTLRGYFGESWDDTGATRCCALANPTLSLMFGWTDGASVRVRGGPALSVPLGLLSGNGQGAEMMNFFGRALLGFWDGWEGFVYGPGALLRGDADARFGALVVGGDVAAGASFWAWRTSGPSDTDPVAVAHYQLGAYVGVEPLEWLALGTRVQVAGWSEGGGLDVATGTRPADAQVSLVPFVRIAPGSWFVEVRSTLNLDEPAGLASESLVWALRVAGGVAVDR